MNTYEVKAKFSSLIERAMLGEDVIICKAGKLPIPATPDFLAGHIRFASGRLAKRGGQVRAVLAIGFGLFVSVLGLLGIAYARVLPMLTLRSPSS